MGKEITFDIFIRRAGLVAITIGTLCLVNYLSGVLLHLRGMALCLSALPHRKVCTIPAESTHKVALYYYYHGPGFGSHRWRNIPYYTAHDRTISKVRPYTYPMGSPHHAHQQSYGIYLGLV